MLNLIKKSLPSFIKNFIKRVMQAIEWDLWQHKSWSQEGEDQVLRRIFENESIGFYIDVGAHHPKRFSNTYLFYKRGWRGINIDAMPGSMNAFARFRPRDINLELGVGLVESKMEYYLFNESALNGFSKELSSLRQKSNKPQLIVDIKKINVLPLSTILDVYLPKDQIIDFMSIDVEGLDYEVIKSNNWLKYRPKIILIEMIYSNLDEISNSLIGSFMLDEGYVLFAKCFRTIFFRRCDYYINRIHADHSA